MRRSRDAPSLTCMSRATSSATSATPRLSRTFSACRRLRRNYLAYISHGSPPVGIEYNLLWLDSIPLNRCSKISCRMHARRLPLAAFLYLRRTFFPRLECMHSDTTVGSRRSILSLSFSPICSGVSPRPASKPCTFSRVIKTAMTTARTVISSDRAMEAEVKGVKSMDDPRGIVGGCVPFDEAGERRSVVDPVDGPAISQLGSEREVSTARC